MSWRLCGSYVALPTPFSGAEVDYAALDRLVDWHVERGSDGLVAVGTTGEGATLSERERRAVIERTIVRARGRIPVVAGIGTNNTAQSIELARFAQVAGAAAALVVTPYYNKPTQAGLVAHFCAIAEASELPLVLYNVPSRTGCDLKPATVAAICARTTRAVALKEASGDLERAREVRASCAIDLVAGEDALIEGFMALGGTGVIGVVANLAPAEVAELCRVARPGGDAQRTAELVAWLAPLCRDLFVETNPVPVKTALARMGWMREDVRLPLVALAPESRERLLATLSQAGLLESAART
ncbi:MAG: 4-hydroxy-tetrahydrodipicolinate synthase [Planctomycetes bacterium]|nr:4-hydroxy-tetrahydrodipicolinate synthase [Planctomycetota bacterium]